MRKINILLLLILLLLLIIIYYIYKCKLYKEHFLQKNNKIKKKVKINNIINIVDSKGNEFIGYINDYNTIK
jgi:hypothetical protein